MKRKLFTVLMLASLLTVIGCGKDNSSGGSDPNYHMNPIQNGQGQVVGEGGYNHLVNWMNNNDESQSNGLRAVYKKKTSGNINVDMQLCGTGYMNLVCERATHCLENQGGQISIGKPIYGGNLDNRLQGCHLQTPYLRSNDVVLKDAILGKAGRIVLKAQTMQTGSVFTIYYTNYPNSTFVTGMAVIDTSLPGVLNPVYVRDAQSETGIKFLSY